jgi:NADH-quinone oxidoreductase subunit M
MGRVVTAVRHSSFVIPSSFVIRISSFQSVMVLFTIFCPIVAAVLIMLGAPARKTALAAAVLTFAAALFLFASLDHGRADFQHVTSFSISPEWRLSFTTGVDGLSVIMVLLASVVTLAAVWFAGTIEKYENAFYACLLFISGGAIGAFASIDLFFFYAFHELALIPTFLLIGIWGSGNRIAAAWKITIYLAVGSFILLLGLILLYQSFPLASRSFDIRALQTAASMGQIPADAQRHVYLLLLIGFGILISLFPFHTWAPEAYAAAPAPVAMLHAGVLKKFGLYGLLRLAIPMLPEGARHWATLLIVLLLGNIVYVGLVTIAQKRLDWMLGYSSVMHMGYIFLGIASFGVLGVTGAVLLIFAHGLSIALLFGVAGELRKRTGTLAFDELGGIAKVMPFAGLAFGLGVFAAVGLPGFANFAGEILIFFGAFRNGWEIGRLHMFQIATILALWGVVMSTVYMLRAYRKTFMGAMREQWQKLPDLSPALRVPVILLVAALLCYGFFPQIFVRNVAPMFRSYLSANTGHLENMQRYSHSAVSANGAEFIASLGQAPQDPWNKKTSALKARLTESRLQRSYWYDRIPGALPQAHMTKAPLALDRCGAVDRPDAAGVTEGNASQARGYNDLATK